MSLFVLSIHNWAWYESGPESLVREAPICQRCVKYTKFNPNSQGSSTRKQPYTTLQTPLHTRTCLCTCTSRLLCHTWHIPTEWHYRSLSDMVRVCLCSIGWLSQRQYQTWQDQAQSNTWYIVPRASHCTQGPLCVPLTQNQKPSPWAFDTQSNKIQQDLHRIWYQTCQNLIKNCCWSLTG